MAGKDYYRILGVSKNATPEEIKKAYRKLTKEFHPDVNKDPGAEDKFKEINEAYDALTNPSKKASYNDGFSGSSTRKGYNPYDTGGTPYTSGDYWGPKYEDLFKDLFKQKYYGGNSGFRSGLDLDITLPLSLTFMEVALGKKAKVNFTRKIICQSCNGQGKKGFTQSCSKCNGRKVIRVQKTIPGIPQVMEFTETCPSCLGSGQEFGEICQPCSGSGYSDQKESIEVSIPAGVETGQSLKIKGYGNKSSLAIGDLYLQLNIEETHPVFTRKGLDIWSTKEVSLKDLLLGGEIDVQTIHGSMKVTIPFGSQPNSKIKLAKQGINDGNHVLELNLILPKKLTPEQQELIRKLDL